MRRKPNRPQITLRGLDPELAAEVERLARSEGISTNKAVIRLLRKGAGLGESKAAGIGSSLDHLIGTWSAKEATQLLQSIKSCEQVDADFWT